MVGRSHRGTDRTGMTMRYALLLRYRRSQSKTLYKRGYERLNFIQLKYNELLRIALEYI